MKQTTIPIREAAKGKRQSDKFEPNGKIWWTASSTGKVTICLPTLPPSKNRYIRRHWRTQQRDYFKPWEAWVSQGWFFEDRKWACPPPHFEGAVKISVQFTYPDKRRRDSQNLFAFPPLFDALVKLGVIEDDNGAIELLPPEIVRGKSETWIHIIPVKGAHDDNTE